MSDADATIAETGATASGRLLASTDLLDRLALSPDLPAPDFFGRMALVEASLVDPAETQVSYDRIRFRAHAPGLDQRMLNSRLQGNLLDHSRLNGSDWIDVWYLIGNDLDVDVYGVMSTEETIRRVLDYLSYVIRRFYPDRIVFTLAPSEKLVTVFPLYGKTDGRLDLVFPSEQPFPGGVPLFVRDNIRDTLAGNLVNFVKLVKSRDTATAVLSIEFKEGSGTPDNVHAVATNTLNALTARANCDGGPTKFVFQLAGPLGV